MIFSNPNQDAATQEATVTVIPNPPGALPQLPDLQELVQAANARKAHFERIRDDAQAEIDKAQAYIDKLNGELSEQKAPPPYSGRGVRGENIRRGPAWASVSNEAVEATLQVMSHRQHRAELQRIAHDAKLSVSTIGRAVHRLEEAGFVETSYKDRRLHAKLTDSGYEKAREIAQRNSDLGEA